MFNFHKFLDWLKTQPHKDHTLLAANYLNETVRIEKNRALFIATLLSNINLYPGDKDLDDIKEFLPEIDEDYEKVYKLVKHFPELIAVKKQDGFHNHNKSRIENDFINLFRSESSEFFKDLLTLFDADLHGLFSNTEDKRKAMYALKHYSKLNEVFCINRLNWIDYIEGK